MISLIVCSRTPKLSDRLLKNVSQTVGADFEWVVIDNSHNQRSIFQAYNEGVRRAKGDLLCFMHDDIEFITPEWGQRIKAHFSSHADVGVIGFGGAHYVPNAALYWSALPFVSEHHQHNDHGTVIDCVCTDYFHGEQLADVVECDGLCLFIPQKLFADGLRFDEDYYRGFHAYDIDICMQAIAAGWRVCVCRDVMVMHHYSERTASKKKGMDMFQPNLRLFQQKWSHMLPVWRGIDLPTYAAHRLNGLCCRAADAYVARHSAAYRLGSVLVRPVKRLAGWCVRHAARPGKGRQA